MLGRDTIPQGWIVAARAPEPVTGPRAAPVFSVPELVEEFRFGEM